MSFGSRMKECRLRMGYNQKDAAEKIGIKNNSLSSYENDVRQPDLKTLKIIANLYEVTSDYLIGRSSNPKLTTEQDEQVKKETPEWMNLFNQLSKEDQAIFESTIKKFVKEKKHPLG